MPWLSIGSARRCLALTESGEKSRACPVGTGPVFCAFFPAAGEKPILRLAFGREEPYNKNAQCLGCQSAAECLRCQVAPMAARSARAHQEANSRARGLHPRQVAPVAARSARAHQEANSRARRRRVKFFAQLSRKKAGRVWDSVPRSYSVSKRRKVEKASGGRLFAGNPRRGFPDWAVRSSVVTAAFSCPTAQSVCRPLA